MLLHAVGQTDTSVSQDHCAFIFKNLNYFSLSTHHYMAPQNQINLSQP
jgi:hypothetical protein